MSAPDPVRVCIVTGFGINTDREMATAFGLAGAHPVRVHVNDLIADPAALDRFAIFVLPGGFSFGDHVGSGALLAALLTRALREPLARFVDRGGLVLGVCNGFQVLVRMGWCPRCRRQRRPGAVGGAGAQRLGPLRRPLGAVGVRPRLAMRVDALASPPWNCPCATARASWSASEAQLAAIDAAHLGTARYTSPHSEPPANGESPRCPTPRTPTDRYATWPAFATPPAGCSASCRTRRHSCTATTTQPGATPRPPLAAALDQAALALFRNAVHHAATR